MISVLIRTLVVCAGLALTAFPVFAGEIRNWDDASFAEAQAAGEPILLHVTAPWCPTCRAQKPVVESLAAAPDNAALVVFDIDFDSQKDVLRRFDVRQQSTLIAFVGDREVGRAVAITSTDAISALIAETH